VAAALSVLPTRPAAAEPITLPPPLVRPSTGYWLVAADGGMFTYGDAEFHGSAGAIRLNQPIVAAATAGTAGYWEAAADGGVFAYGVPFFGSTGSIRLNQPIVGMAPTASGEGYWLVARDGGIFAFGDAAFSGSTGAIALNQPIVGMAPDLDGRGYWLVAADGGVFSFDAPFLGPQFLLPALDDVVVGIAAAPPSPVAEPGDGTSLPFVGRGYWIAWRSGRVVPIGSAPNVGDPIANGRDVVGITSNPTGRGYWVALAPPV
jgi:hypothetical protein